MELSFNNLPEAITLLIQKVETIERLLLVQQSQGTKTDHDRLMTVTETAEFLNLSVPTIYGLVQKAEIPVNKKGKRLYFSHSELTEWIKSGRRKTNIELNAEAELYLQSNKKGGKR